MMAEAPKLDEVHRDFGHACQPACGQQALALGLVLNLCSAAF